MARFAGEPMQAFAGPLFCNPGGPAVSRGGSAAEIINECRLAEPDRCSRFGCDGAAFAASSFPHFPYSLLDSAGPVPARYRLDATGTRSFRPVERTAPS